MIRLFLIFLIPCFLSCKKGNPPAPVGALPSASQLKWQDLEFYAFVHFNMNTFNNIEWGFGDTKPEQFNPTELDCRQWARVCKEAGMKGIILTTKHHDGFCLWPSKFTEYSVKNSPWKNGKGDVVRELSDACKAYGLNFGIYLSPWDRNNADYGTPAYVEYYRNQMRELLTNYGEIFEVWLDGANGGTGFYGGANEERKVDKKTYYDWPKTFKMIYELQPNAIIFSDGGPGCRWVGNESGFAYETNWSTLNGKDFAPGVADMDALHFGQEDGTDWIPTEVDVSIRPGWYYHAFEDNKVRTLSQLVDMYYNSVGRNGNLLLSFPVDRRGLIHENDVEQVLKLRAQLNKDFTTDLAKGNFITVTDDRGNGFTYGNLNDGKSETYWATSDSITNASAIINFGNPTEFNCFLVQEYIALGQRVRKFSVEIFENEKWTKIAEGTTIGHKRILRFPTVMSDKVRLNIEDSKACILISNIEIYRISPVLESPGISRDQQGIVTLTSTNSIIPIYFTVDGSEPDIHAAKYTQPFMFTGKGVVKAITTDPGSGKISQVNTFIFDVNTNKWKVLKPTENLDSKFAFDGDDQTSWGFKTDRIPAELIIDLGESLRLSGFAYTPDQSSNNSGVVFGYEIYVSNDVKNWGEAATSGEFSNIMNNPVKQEINFSPVSGRYIKFKEISEANGRNEFRLSEFSVKTTN